MSRTPNGPAPCRSCGRIVAHAIGDDGTPLRLEPQLSIDGEHLLWWEDAEPAGRRIQRTRSVVTWERAEGRAYQGPRHRAHEGDLCPGTIKQRRRGISPGTGGAGCL